MMHDTTHGHGHIIKILGLSITMKIRLILQMFLKLTLYSLCSFPGKLTDLYGAVAITVGKSRYFVSFSGACVSAWKSCTYFSISISFCSFSIFNCDISLLRNASYYFTYRGSGPGHSFCSSTFDVLFYISVHVDLQMSER